MHVYSYMIKIFTCTQLQRLELHSLEQWEILITISTCTWLQRSGKSLCTFTTILILITKGQLFKKSRVRQSLQRASTSEHYWEPKKAWNNITKFKKVSFHIFFCKTNFIFFPHNMFWYRKKSLGWVFMYSRKKLPPIKIMGIWLTWKIQIEALFLWTDWWSTLHQKLHQNKISSASTSSKLSGTPPPPLK
jgi:hypothetical protein